MDNYPLVSILIPLYNHDKFIVRCLESAANNGYRNTEILVIDDGSTDESASTVTKWYETARERIDCTFEFTVRENKGLSATLNELYEKSLGDYIVILASDDYLLPGGIEARVSYLFEHPEKMFVVGDYSVVDEADRKLNVSGIEEIYHGRKKYLLDDRTIAAELVFNWCLAGSIYLGRRELYRDHTYDEDLVIEDWDYCLRIAANGWMGFIDYPVCAYRVYPKPPGYNENREIQCTNSMLITARKNMQLFNGLPRLFLWAETLRYRGYLARLTGKNRLLALLMLELGRMVMRMTKRLHHRNCPS